MTAPVDHDAGDGAGGAPAGAARSRAARSRRPLGRLLLAVAGGLALWLAFPPFDLWPLAVVGPLALGLAVRGCRPRHGALLGMVLGLTFLLPLLQWAGIFVGPVPWVALSILQASFYAALGAAAAVVQRLRGAPLWLASLWVGAELARSSIPFGGLPWGRLAFSQADSPFGALALLGGAPLASFGVALTGFGLGGVAVAAAAARRRRVGAGTATRGAPARRTAAALAGAVAVAPLAGLAATAALPGPSLTEGGPTKVVGVVQGDVPRPGLDFNAERRAVLDNHVEVTLDLLQQVEDGQAPAPDLVLWPENSTDIDPFVNADARAQIERAVDAAGVPVLVGAVLRGPGEFLTNAGIVWDPQDGPGAQYAKRHPVPFGEYIPYRSFFRLFSPYVDRLQRDFAPGSDPGALDVAGTTVGDVICFEVAYDSLVRDVVVDGSRMIVVQTNNATFGYSAESVQQLAMSRVRAMEHGRAVVVVSTSGISAVIAPDGTVVDRSELFTPWSWVGEIAQRDGRTPATLVGAWPERVLTGVGVLALLAAVVSARRNRSGVASG